MLIFARALKDQGTPIPQIATKLTITTGRTPQAFGNADGPESDAAPSSAGNARDCGSGPLACTSGYTCFRHDTQPRVTADPSGDPNTVYVVYDATKPNTEVPSTSTYNTAPIAADGTLRVGQGAIYLTKTTNGGRTWSTPEVVDNESVGRQWFPDINADDGQLHLMWSDSRNDTCYSVQRPAGDCAATNSVGDHQATRQVAPTPTTPCPPTVASRSR